MSIGFYTNLQSFYGQSRGFFYRLIEDQYYIKKLLRNMIFAEQLLLNRYYSEYLLPLYFLFVANARAIAEITAADSAA